MEATDEDIPCQPDTRLSFHGGILLAAIGDCARTEHPLSFLSARIYHRLTQFCDP